MLEGLKDDFLSTAKKRCVVYRQEPSISRVLVDSCTSQWQLI